MSELNRFRRKLILYTTLVLIPFCGILAQGEVSYRKILDDQEVPKEVRAGFKSKYPKTFMSMWYTSHITYWYEDYAPSWYGSWYPTRQIVVHKFEKPAYYEVDFHTENESSRAIFNRFGQWFETRTKILSLPEEVAAGLKNSEYGDWIWSDHKEKIEAIGLPGINYRLQVSKANQRYIVRLDETGNIVQIKYE